MVAWLWRVLAAVLFLVFFSTALYIYDTFRQCPAPLAESGHPSGNNNNHILQPNATPTHMPTKQPIKQEPTKQPVTQYRPVPEDKGHYMCNVAVAVYSQPAHAETRVKDAMNSWTKRICSDGTPQFIFVGLPESLNIPRAIDVPCKTDYFSLCCKSMEGLARLYQKYPNADWYYKVDDDTLLVPRNVDILLAQFDPNKKYLLGYAIDAGIDPETKEFRGQIFMPVKQHESGQIYRDKIAYCSGSGYIMSGALVRGMMANMTKYKEVWTPICDLYDPEDVAVGLFSAVFGAQVTHINGVYNRGWNWEDETGPKENYEMVSVHLSRNTERMIMVDRIASGAFPKPRIPK